MAGLDPRFVVTTSLDEYFVDKDTGLPLADGVITFYHDDNRSVLKAIYTISGSPPNYTYVALPNPLTLSAVGTPEDNSGNNVPIYYFPLDGTPNDTTNELDLYYITVESAGSVLQFTREGWPNIGTSGGGTTENLENFIPNGQFLTHDNFHSADGTTTGFVPAGTTAIAQGGWYFEKPSPTSTSTDQVLFSRFGSIVDTPTANPRYAVEVKTTIAGSDSFKYLSIRFPNVNMFSSTSGNPQAYTFGFYGIDNNFSNTPINILLIRNFGLGGSSTIVTTLGTFNIPSAWTLLSLDNIIFPDNSSATLGTDDSDYVELVISFPGSRTFDLSFTDFILTPGAVTLTAVPYQTNAVTLADSVTGFMPTPDANGANLYLPLILTKAGMTFDTSEIGDVLATMSAVPVSPTSTSPLPTSNRIYCDGSNFLYSGYSALGIPFSRLGNVLWDSTNNVFIYGSGGNFVTAYTISVSTSQIYLTNNAFGSSSNPANGVSSPGFSYSAPVTTASTLGYFANAYVTGINHNEIIIQNEDAQFVTATSAGTSGFTVATYQNPASLSDTTTNRTSTLAISSVLTVNGATLHVASGAAKYFEFTTFNGSTNTTYYVWYTINGTGSDPSLGGGTVGIQVVLPSTTAYTATDVAYATASAINGALSTLITTAAGSTIPEGSYFTFSGDDAKNYVVWYTQLTTSSPPVVGGITTFIRVLYTTGDTAATIATNTLISINKTYYAVPNLQGVFLRGTSPNFEWDIDAAVRFGVPYNVFGNRLGTFELSQLISHNHFGNGAGTSGSSTDPSFFRTDGGTIASSTNPCIHASLGTLNFVTTPTTTLSDQIPLVIAYDGGTENRPINTFVNYVIKY